MDSHSGSKGIENAARLISEFNAIPIDHKEIPQHELDLNEDRKPSQFQWSGQFPLELADTLVRKYAGAKVVVADPFCGSGTTLFAAASKSTRCIGADINPAAIELSKNAFFCKIKREDREKYLAKAWELLGPLTQDSSDEAVKELLEKPLTDPLVRTVVINSLMRLYVSKPRDIAMAFETYKKIIERLPNGTAKIEVIKADARDMPLEKESVDLILTSPPYPGVFDYYKNYKKVAWLAGWKMSEYASREIGKGNASQSRYESDTVQALLEMNRILKKNGRLILVIGRENAATLYALAVGQCGFKIALRQERSFRGRLGKTIREDILHFTK